MTLLHTFAATSNTDEALSHIIQLIILCIPLFILPGLIKGSSQIMGKISGAAERFQQRSGLEKGLGKAHGGMKNVAKNKVLNTEARMAASNNSAFSRAGNFRSRRKFKLDNQGRERDRAQQDALGNYIGSSESFRSRAAGVGGADGVARLEGYESELKQKRKKEEIDQRVAALTTSAAYTGLAGAGAATGNRFGVGGAQSEFLANQLLSSIQSGDTVGAIAAKRQLMNQGGDGLAAMRAISAMNLGAEGAPTRDAARELAANMGQEDYGEIKEKAPELLNFVNSAGAEGINASGIGKVSSEGLGKLDTKSLEYHIANGSLGQSDLVDAKNSTAWEKLSKDHKDIINRNIQSTGGPAPQPSGGGSSTPPPTPGSTSPGGVVIPSTDETRRFGG